MATIKNGILDGFSGKLGPVVGFNRNGAAFTRRLPHTVHNPRTLGQRSQRSKLSLVIRLLRPLAPLLRLSWKLYAHNQLPFHAATAYTMANAITGTYPGQTIDPDKVLVSCGNLTPASGVAANLTDGKIQFTWENNSGIGNARQTDKAIVAVINLGKGEAVTGAEGAERSAETYTIAIPAGWTGDEIDVYLGFISKDGKEASNSTYVGCVTV